MAANRPVPVHSRAHYQNYRSMLRTSRACLELVKRTGLSAVTSVSKVSHCQVLSFQVIYLLFSFASLSRIENISIISNNANTTVSGGSRVYCKILNSVKYKSRDK